MERNGGKDFGFAAQEAQRYFWMQPGETTTAKDDIWLERDDQACGDAAGRGTSS